IEAVGHEVARALVEDAAATPHELDLARAAANALRVEREPAGPVGRGRIVRRGRRDGRPRPAPAAEQTRDAGGIRREGFHVPVARSIDVPEPADVIAGEAGEVA